jgi:hypothetical protein
MFHPQVVFAKIVEAVELDFASKGKKTRPPHGTMGGTKLAETEIPMDQRKCPLEFLLAGSSSSSDEDDNKQSWKDDQGDSYDDDGDDKGDSYDDDGDYAPAEDNDGNDDDFVDIEVESDDECRSSFPKLAKSQRGHPLLPGGSQKPDVSKITASMAAMAQKEYRAKRKAWTDAVCVVLV